MNNWEAVDEYTLHLPHETPTAPETGEVTLADMVDNWYTNGGKIFDLVCSHIDMQRAIRLRQKETLQPALLELYKSKCANPINQ